MVFQKSFDYGCSGHQVPAVPRVPKSAKGKRSIRKKLKEKQMHAFDLLVRVAGELLLEEKISIPNNSNESSRPTTLKDTAKEVEANEQKPLKHEPCDQGSCNESPLASEAFVRRQIRFQPKEKTCSPKATASGSYCLFEKSGEIDKHGHREPSMFDGNNREIGRPELGFKSEGLSHGPAEFCDGNAANRATKGLQVGCQKAEETIYGNDHATGSLVDPMELDVKLPSIVSSDSSVEVPFCSDRVAHDGSFAKSHDAMEILDRDNDENSSGCTNPSIMINRAPILKHSGDRRANNLASKYWRRASSTTKNRELCSTDAEAKLAFRNRKMCYTRKRTQRSSSKKRKVFEHGSFSASERESGKGHVSISNEAFNAEPRDSNAGGLHGVKLSIKSFKVPELFIEIPETATVGSLKKTVMEAVTAILGGGLCVGVLLEGKNIRDDTKTLLQAGICHVDEVDNLGFMLEPNHTQVPAMFESRENLHLPNPCDEIEPLNRIPDAVTPKSDTGRFTAKPEPPPTSVVNCPESDHDSVHSPTILEEKDGSNSRALVPVPAMDAKALAVVPLRKPKRPELVQRRIRRPFSVSEVEALVQAVEKLGTGRWRDVKLRAFDNSKHRTYVDLKDKWKTLVHTARISPQQRRGEPVPQELLDRVLSAHAYWSQQQTKLPMKAPQAEACLLR